MGTPKIVRSNACEGSNPVTNNYILVRYTTDYCTLEVFVRCKNFLANSCTCNQTLTVNKEYARA